MIFAGWSEGAVYNNQEDFETYVQKTALEFYTLTDFAYKRFKKKQED